MFFKNIMYVPIYVWEVTLYSVYIPSMEDVQGKSTNQLNNKDIHQPTKLQVTPPKTFLKLLLLFCLHQSRQDFLCLIGNLARGQYGKISKMLD